MAADKLQPQKILYCAVCSMPPEFCEFGPDFEKCKPWLIKNAPNVYPELAKKAADEAEAKLGDLRLGGEDGADGEASTSKPEDEIVKKLPGGKVKKKEKQEILVEKATRNKRKAITTVKGLELFGVKLGEASKKFGKKFASGASVVKGPTEKEQIDVQGDFLYDICEFITETWKEIPESAIYVMEDGKRKVPYADA